MSDQDTIAGHTFEDTSRGRICTAYVAADEGQKLCAITWLHVRAATLADIGERGFAHSGKLNQAEYDQIVKERKKEEDAIWQAVIDAASSGTR